MKENRPKIFVTIVSSALLVVQVLTKAIDTTALALIGLALLPWLGSVFDVAEFGGLKLAFTKVKREQERQAQELAWIKTLIKLIVSDYERAHLQHFAADGPFMADTNSGFEWELRHLLTQNFIDRVPGKGMRSLFESPGTRDVKEHFSITQRGKDYLRLLEDAGV